MGKIVSIIWMMTWWFYIPVIAYGEWTKDRSSFMEVWYAYWDNVNLEWC